MRSDDRMVKTPLITEAMAALNRDIHAALNGAGDMAEMGAALAGFGQRGLIDHLTAVLDNAAEIAMLAPPLAKWHRTRRRGCR